LIQIYCYAGYDILPRPQDFRATNIMTIVKQLTEDRVGNNLQKHKLIVPTLRAHRYAQVSAGCR